MAYKTGADTIIALKPATTFGTAAEVGAGDKLEVESLTPAKNPEELRANPIGSGQNMANDVQQGAIAPSIEFEKLLGYNDAAVAALSVFMGGENTIQEAAGVFQHSLIDIGSWNQQFLTAAINATSGGVMEFPSCVVTRCQLTFAEPPNYSRGSFSLLANDRLIAGTTNEVADFASVTVADADRIIVKPEDEFLINVTSGGALSSPDDRVRFRSLTLELTKEQQFVKEVKGSAGNGEPIPSGTPPFTGKLTLEFKSLDDFNWFTASDAGTEYKCSLVVTGGTLSGSLKKKFQIFIPRMKIIEDPNYALSNPGVNPLTVVFECLAASAAPTGMFRTTPYFVIINGRESNHNT